MNTHLIFCFLKSFGIAIIDIFLMAAFAIIWIGPLVLMDDKAECSSGSGLGWRILQVIWLATPIAAYIFVKECL